jgi:hypothetical protein
LDAVGNSESTLGEGLYDSCNHLLARAAPLGAFLLASFTSAAEVATSDSVTFSVILGLRHDWLSK